MVIAVTALSHLRFPRPSSRTGDHPDGGGDSGLCVGHVQLSQQQRSRIRSEGVNGTTSSSS